MDNFIEALLTEYAFVTLILIVGIYLLLNYLTRGHKCPKCATRTESVKEKAWKDITKTKKKSDGTRDRRYKKSGYYSLTIVCSNENCKNIFKSVDFD